MGIDPLKILCRKRHFHITSLSLCFIPTRRRYSGLNNKP
jgi:hypothetical protein